MDAREKIQKNCVGCNLCARDCALLKEVGPIKKLVNGAIPSDVASACMICGLCDSVCPKHLSPREVFIEERIQNIQGKEYTLLSSTSPDRTKTFFQEYKEHYKIDYSPYELQEGEMAESVFFPGCLVNSYLPETTVRTFEALRDRNLCQKMWNGCCSENFITYSLMLRKERHDLKLKEFALRHGIKRVVTPCCNCYFSLTEAFQGTDIRVVSVFDLLDDIKIPAAEGIYTFHDSCSDRIHDHNVFADGMRRILQKNGFHCVEMEHHRDTSLCCGTGGGAQHYRPQYESVYVNKRIEEAHTVNADYLVTYCPNCGMQYIDNPYGFRVRHVLQLMFGTEHELDEAFEQKKHLFDGADGTQRKELLAKAPIIPE